MLNFLANERIHFVEDQELNPMVYAEQFVSPDPLLARPPEELLSRARMIMATELGKDPLLRDHMRKLFRDEGRVSVEPTDHGVSKITNDDKFFVRVTLCGSEHLLITCLEFQISTSKACERHAR